MTRNADQVFKGFLNLTPEEQKELIDAINDYYQKRDSEKRSIKEGLQKRADLGPLAQNRCVCCGR